MFVLVHSGSYYRKPWTGWLITTEIYFTLLEAGRSQVKALAALVSGERLLSPSRAGSLLPVFSHGGRGKGAPWELTYKGTHLVPKVSTLIT